MVDEDRPELLEIRHTWKTSPDYAGLLAFVDHDIEFWQVKEFDPTHHPGNQPQTATLADFFSEELTIDLDHFKLGCLAQ
ncbi:DNA helicase [Colletotrichum kahawae]|uniref:DNA helicase n=1 Tax=Colletotrichum kahawae TaxID=34407 RepID=A0AAD9Y4T3_COLKA|nr:DNA helicase [Colletotrichum kahawae]